ncbi:HD domain-containing protein [Deinococcus lacus]|uniref:HD domain-containing protein n=1 Tax=Deinococcus lacus TaxID=392561 RepID=A0ABW1YD56_9DEIO
MTVRELGRLLEEVRPLSETRRARLPAFERRARTIVAGLTVLHTALTVLGAREAVVSEGALREGMMIEELRRHAAYASGLSARQRSALALAERFGANLAHARHVTALSRELFDQLCQAGAELPPQGRGLLKAAATLHEVGQLIAQSGHHKHSAYLIRHGGLRGFTPAEIEVIAQVARYHRRSLPKASHPEYAALSAEDRRLVDQLSAILRVADGLDRSQASGSKVRRLERSGNGWRLEVTAANALDLAGAESKADLWEREFGPLNIAALEVRRVR